MSQIAVKEPRYPRLLLVLSVTLRLVIIGLGGAFVGMFFSENSMILAETPGLLLTVVVVASFFALLWWSSRQRGNGEYTDFE